MYLSTQLDTKTWFCPACNEELGELNGWCIYCETKDNTRVYNPDMYCIREVRIYNLTTGKGKPMTPQEELYLHLYNADKRLVCDMDTLQLRTLREEMLEVIFKAKVKIGAIDDTESERRKANKDAGKPTGFERNLNIDETTTDAINAIRLRQKKLTKKEQIRKNLVDLYVMGGSSYAEAEAIADKALGNAAVLARVTEKKDKDILLGNETRSPLSSEEGFVIKKSSEELNPAKPSEPVKPIINPFAKKAE